MPDRARAPLMLAALAIAGCSVNVQDGAGPHVPVPNVLGMVERAASPAAAIDIELRTSAGQPVSTTTTTRSGSYGFDVTSSGSWEVKISAGKDGDFDAVTHPILFQDPGPLAVPPIDIFAHGAAALEPAPGASVAVPSATQPLTFRWTQPAITGARARVQLFDSQGVAVWSSSWLSASEVPWDGVGNQGTRTGTPTSAGSYSWRIKFSLPDSSEARIATRPLILQ
jgi:hypothetical protein